MLQLPVELWRQCIECHDNDDDIESLKALRLVNKELQTIATEVLFRTITLNHNEESAQKLKTLAESNLNQFVRRIVINTSSDPNSQGVHQEETNLLESFEEAIKTIDMFRNMEEAELRFARECTGIEADGHWGPEVAETMEFRIEVLEPFFGALKGASKVKSLAIKNLQDHMDKDLFESEDFVVVRNRLTKLHLQIATESDEASPENTISLEACHQGFTHDLPNIWLKPLQNQLTHLTLYSTECLWGVWPFVDLRVIPVFPRLISLSLGNLTIVHDWQIDWVLSHASTLEELRLDDCYIVTALRLNKEQAAANFPDLSKIPDYGSGLDEYFTEVELRWHDVFSRFNNGLPHLNNFSIGHGNWYEGRAFEERYQLFNQLPSVRYFMFDWGIGPSQWIEMHGRWGAIEYNFDIRRSDSKELIVQAPTCDKEDLDALCKLMKVVKTRASAHI